MRRLATIVSTLLLAVILFPTATTAAGAADSDDRACSPLRVGGSVEILADFPGGVVSGDHSAQAVQVYRLRYVETMQPTEVSSAAPTSWRSISMATRSVR